MQVSLYFRYTELQIVHKSFFTLCRCQRAAKANRFSEEEIDKFILCEFALLRLAQNDIRFGLPEFVYTVFIHIRYG